ncbi:hypothetical protein EDB83DRAFT_1373200 [Lactarius deliciosus]|nr:hypothetical protein EDB83DRAFT_1373200 [Lactarius deliciosus]
MAPTESCCPQERTLYSEYDSPDGRRSLIPGWVPMYIRRTEMVTPLIHRSEIVLHEAEPPTRNGGWWENTRTASIDGRSILVKSYDSTRAEQFWSEDIAFLKSAWDAHLPQLFGISHKNSTPLFIVLHDTGRTDLKSFVTPVYQIWPAITRRCSRYSRCRAFTRLSMLANTGRWPAIYGQVEYPSLAMLSSIRVDNRGNVVIGANITSDRRGTNHRGPLVWLCHEVGGLFDCLTPKYRLTPCVMLRYLGIGYPGSALAIGEEDPVKRACQLANQIAGSILLCGAQPPTHVSSTILMDLRDVQWTPPMLRELRASMVDWSLDDRSGMFSNYGYGDVGFLISDPVSRKRTFTVIGNVRKIFGPQQSKILGVDEPFRKRLSIDYPFEGEFNDVITSEISPNITRFTFVRPSYVSYQQQFSLHEKPRDAYTENASRWRSITARVSSLAQEYNIPLENMILVTGHRTSINISTNFMSAIVPPPNEVHLFMSYEDYVTSYWSYEAQYKPTGDRRALVAPQAFINALPLSERRAFYIQFIPEDFSQEIS